MAKTSKQALLKLVDRFPRLTITVVADLVADEFIFGEIARVSREAPVLILKRRERTVVPGGGGNAIMNLAELGVTVMPVGVVGEDEPGELLLEQFHKKKISTSGITRLKEFSTVTKTRILAGHTHTSRQQVVRVDREPESEISERLLMPLVNGARKYATASDAALISDYGYGAATPRIVNLIKSNGCFKNLPVTLDSRFRILDFEGITSATPNEPEVETALGCRIGNDREKLVWAGKELLKRLRLESAVITRGRDGMAVFARGAKPVEIAIHGGDQVVDVTGAGDTVIATFTAALAAGADAVTAARLANYAGGIVVMKRGTATVSRDELKEAIQSE